MRGLVVNADGSTEIKEMPCPEYNEYQALVKLKAEAFAAQTKKYYIIQKNSARDIRLFWDMRVQG